MDFREELTRRLAGVELRWEEPMSRHTTFRIGGPAQVMALPRNEEQIALVCRTAREMELPLLVTGCGSNLLVGDRGIRGVVLKLSELVGTIEPEPQGAWLGAGLRLSRAAEWAMRQGLTGMEFAHGIPGSVGGAVFMNAGAYGGEMSHIVRETRYVDIDGTMGTVRGEEHGFGYRTSCFQQSGRIVIATRIELTPGDREAIEARMRDLAQRRREKQPLNYPSAGSTFKRPEGYFAGQLIQEAGLKGLRVGGAMVSEKHAGFVVSDGTATCADVKALIREVQRRVKENSGVELHCEVQMVGDD
ncbi:MAG: UDP-N-acetylmuramate dehydrogenase [Eubacteriales bacterium]